MFTFGAYLTFSMLLLLSKRTLEVDNFEVELEPGHVKQDYDSVEEVRGHINESVSEATVEIEPSLKEAILDVAYYLRRFKFNGCDPRYSCGRNDRRKNIYIEFPTPPLRNIHWEVKKYCESSFVECVKYLQDQVSRTILPRQLDSLTVIKQNGWSFATDKDLIRAANDQCLRLLEKDENTSAIFSGPLQKFQWLTSAIYYMCLYTMKETSYLKVFTEDCDNFASCIAWDVGPNNKDIRADNTYPFSCALYSFCPDPCCPLKYLDDPAACFDVSPCSASSSQDRRCWLTRKSNVDMESLMLNKWNITCNCDQTGMRWDPKSGMCVDIDECIEVESACNYPSETCKNLLGTYKCICNPLGYRINFESNQCERDPIMQQVLYPSHFCRKNETQTLTNRFADAITKLRSLIPIGQEPKSNCSDS